MQALLFFGKGGVAWIKAYRPPRHRGGSMLQTTVSLAPPTPEQYLKMTAEERDRDHRRALLNVTLRIQEALFWAQFGEKEEFLMKQGGTLIENRMYEGALRCPQGHILWVDVSMPFWQARTETWIEGACLDCGSTHTPLFVTSREEILHGREKAKAL